MRKILPSHRSRLAAASLRAARLGVPVIVLSVLAHRLDLVSTPQFLLLMLVGSLVALIAFLGALLSMTRLWSRGGQGWMKAIRAGFYALVALLPFGAALAAYMHYPQLSDISTDLDNPPALGAGEGGGIEPQAAALQAEAYPDLVSRRFRIAPSELHKAALTVANQSGWELTAELPPGLPDEPTRFQAIATTPIFAFRDDVAVRILPDPVGARLDIRSASQVALHDLGTNARRIRAFFRDLDAVLLAAYGVIEAVDDDEADASADSGELPLLDPDAPAATPAPPPVPGSKPEAATANEAGATTPPATANGTGTGTGTGTLPPLVQEAPGIEALPSDLTEIYQDDEADPAAPAAPPRSRLEPVAGQ